VAIPPELAEILVCPACRGDLAEHPGSEGTEPGLECLLCGRVYPVRDDIPVMLVEEASPPTRSTAEDRS
jgi:uncharacterized protein YbaR (Trm112 family)